MFVKKWNGEALNLDNVASFKVNPLRSTEEYSHSLDYYTFEEPNKPVVMLKGTQEEMDKAWNQVFKVGNALASPGGALAALAILEDMQFTSTEDAAHWNLGELPEPDEPHDHSDSHEH